MGKSAYNPSHVAETTNWRCLFKPDGGTVWLCQTCSRRARMVAHTLIRILGTGLVQLDHVGGIK